MQRPPGAEQDEKKARAKRAHRLSMLAIGWWFVACAAAGLYITFSTGDLPAFMYGHPFGVGAPAPEVRPPAPPVLVHWKQWGARDGDKLIFLDLCARWSRDCRVMDERTYSDAEAASVIEKTFVPVRVDADARPDLALRYAAGELPATAVLFPNGALLDAKRSMAPKLLAAWAKTLESAYRRNHPSAEQAAARQAGWLESAPARGGRARGRDPVTGGLWHGATRPGRRGADYSELLADQDYIGPASDAFPELALADPRGGYYAGLSGEVRRSDGATLEGFAYMKLDASQRKLAGAAELDKRLFAAANGARAAAVLSLEGSGSAARRHALRTLERWWKSGIEAGAVRHELSAGVCGLLRDELALADAYAAAYEATGERRQLDRAVVLARWSESNLMDEASKALFDRPDLKDLPSPLNRLLIPSQNAEAARVYARLARDLPVGEPFRERLKARAIDLGDWLKSAGR